MSISTYTKEQNNTIFNPDDFIDDNYISRSEADIRFLNANQNLEKLFGSLDIVNDATMTNQLVTGSSIINQNLTAGHEGDGITKESASTMTLKGNISIGDQNNTKTVTTALGRVNIGWAQPVNVRGSTVGINVETTNGTTATVIGNGSNSTTVNGALTVNGGTNNITMAGSTIGLNSLGTGVSICNIGKENNNTTNIPGVVNIGSSTKTTSIDASNINLNTSAASGTTTIGNGTSLINLNSINVDIGNDNLNSVTEIKGRTIAIGNTPPPAGVASGIQIGAGGLVADAVNGQTNTFVSTVNKIFNPKICDAYGAIVPTRNFNLNNPSFFVFNENITQENGTYKLPQVGTLKNVIFYLYTPSLTNLYTYAFSFEFYYYMMTGRLGTTTNPPMINASTNAKVINSSFSLILTKISGDTGYTFTPYALHENMSPFKSYSSTSTSGSFPGITGSCTPLGFAKASDGRITITIQFPQMTQTSTSNTADFVCSRGCSLRLCSSSISSGTQQVYPNNAMDSFGGTSYFQLS